MLTAVPISEISFAKYREGVLESLTKETARIKDVSDAEARISAEHSFYALFPDNHPRAKDQFIFDLMLNKDRVGVLHFGIRRDANAPYIYLWDIWIAPGFRGKGLGHDTMAIVEEQAQELDCQRIVLHVFGNNEIAKKLYERRGYEVRSQWMEKRLPAVAAPSLMSARKGLR